VSDSVATVREAAAPLTPPPAPAWRNVATGVAAALVTVAIWAAWPTITRYGVTGGAMDPMTIAVLRFLPPALILAPFWLRVGLMPKMSPLAALGLFCGGLPFFLGAAIGFKFASVANSIAVASGVIPLAVALIARFAFGTLIGRVRAVGLGLIVAAMTIAIVYALSSSGEPYLWLGQLLFASSNFGFALYTLAFPYSRLSALEATGVVAVWSLVLSLPFGAAGVVHAVTQGMYGQIALQVVQQGLLSGLTAFLAYNFAISRLGPVPAATIVAVTPALSTTVAWLALGEVPSPVMLFAVGLITLGVMVASLAGRVRPA